MSGQVKITDNYDCSKAFEYLTEEIDRMLRKRAMQQRRSYFQIKKEFEEHVKKDALRLREQ